MNDNAFCPIWSDTSVKDEILVFVKEDGAVFANLLFDGVEELVITDREGRLLERDKDYFVKGNKVFAIKEVPYFEYVRGIRENPVAVKVKLADIAHNSDQTRLSGCGMSEEAKAYFRDKYTKAKAILLEE